MDPRRWPAPDAAATAWSFNWLIRDLVKMVQSEQAIAGGEAAGVGHVQLSDHGGGAGLGG